MNRLALLLASALACFRLDPVAIGQKIEQAPLEDLNGTRTVFPLTGKTTAIVFLSAECPVSNAYNDRMIALYRTYSARGVQWIFVNANQNESAALVKDHVRAAEFPFPVYKDRANRLADRLGATLTPEAYVIDSAGKLRYRGHIDDARNPARVQVHGLRDALEATLKGEPVARQETKAFGCTIKRVRKTS